MIITARNAVLGAGLLLLGACGSGGGDIKTYVNLCKRDGERADICRCRANYLKKNTTKKDFSHYADVLRDLGKLPEGEAAAKLMSIAFSDAAFMRVAGKETAAEAACVKQ